MSKKITVSKAIGEALHEEMLRDEKVFIMGEDMAVMGNVFAITKGFLEEFGPNRVIDTPISEEGFVGMAVGAAMRGLRPVVELMYDDFATECADPLFNQAAKIRYMTGGQCSVPMVLRALMGANVHRRSLSPFDMARQLETLREVLSESGQLPEGTKEQAELMAAQSDLSRATVERYLDLLNLDETMTGWAERGEMTMTDAYEMARRKNVHLQAAVEEYVAHNNANGDFPGLVHRAIAWAKAAELPPPPPKPAPAANPLRTVDSFGRAVRRSTAQLKALDLSADVDRTTARKKLDTCLANLEELRRTVEALKAGLDG